MNKKHLLVTLTLLLLAGAAAYILSDWFKEQPIQIECLIRRAPPARRPQSAANAPSGHPGYNVTFAFNRRANLTSIRVYSRQEVLTNKFPHAIWNIRSVSNAVPTKSIIYGGWIRGMEPTVKGATADPLEPGGSYRIVIEADEAKAEKDFQVPR